MISATSTKRAPIPCAASSEQTLTWGRPPKASSKLQGEDALSATDTIVMSADDLPFARGVGASTSPHPPPPSAPPPMRSRPNLYLVDPSAFVEVEAEPRSEVEETAKKLKSASVAPAASQRIGGAFVKLYRVFGFAILTVILGGLLTYVGTHVFFLVNRSWVAPSILTPADPRVLGFASRFVEESARRDALLVQRADVETRRREAERTVAIEKAFQSAYTTAMRADLADRKSELARARGVLGSYGQARRSIASAGDAFSASSEQRLKKELEAGVIDKDRMLGGNLQLAQIADARLTLDARSVEAQGRVAALSRMVDSLDAAIAGGAVSSYEILKIRAEYDRSVAAAAKAADELAATTKSLAMLDDTIKAEERILETMTHSAYHGITKRTVFAFVPYDNASATKEGAPIYACRVGIVGCRQVGKLGKVADGEVVQKHPLLHQDVRGVFVRMEIDDAASAESAVLHVGRKPLFF